MGVTVSSGEEGVSTTGGSTGVLVGVLELSGSVGACGVEVVPLLSFSGSVGLDG